ncbi:VCBS repeat-containing protein [Candidatus Poribacteria bacterium]|nr:VCBS repeat-containing protein [Candidatus Poribacteria bacterium]
MKKRNLSNKRFLSAKPGSVARHIGQFRRNLFSILVFGVLLSGYAGLLGEAVEQTMPAAPEFTFEQYEVKIGTAKRKTVLTGFLLDGDFAELAVLHIDENDSQHLRIYAFSDNTWVPKVDTTLRSEVLFVDVANVGGHDRLITYEQGRLNWFDPDLATERPLVGVASNFKPPRSGEIPHVDITRDVNGDARDDLVVPDSDGFWVFIQMSDGTFAEKVKIGPSTEMARIRGADGYRYDPWSQSRVHEIDYDRDGRTDLAFWNEDHFKVHLQDERGLFTSRTKTFTTDVAFDSDRLSLLAAGDMTGRVLHSLADLNGDGVADLVIFKLSGKNISNKHSSYEVHFGAPAPNGGIVFGQDVNIAFESDERIQLGMDRHDFNNDGKVDLMITTIDLEHLEGGLWKSIKGFMGDDVGLGLEFYQMEESLYPDRPNTTRGIALDGVPSHREPGWVPLDIVLRGGTHESRNAQKRYPRAFNTTLHIGDVTGDGRSDLLLADHPRIMVVFVGVPGPEIFAQQPQRVAIPAPNDEEYTWLVDLNKDGVQDILMHHPFTLRDAHGARRKPPGTEPHRVTVLIAQ